MEKLTFIPALGHDFLTGWNEWTINRRLPDFIREAGFKNVEIAGAINTEIRTSSYFTAIKL